MPIDVQKLAQNKLNIIQFIKNNGPSLPIRIAKAIESSPLFTAAFLSELHKEQKLKMSVMKIGSSPLYYLPGQESQLENFSDHLGQREKEAFISLQKSKILKDEEQTPVTRVALRSLKDFAIPIKIRIKEEVKLFWKYFLLAENEIRPLLKNNSSSEIKEKAEEETKPKLEEKSPKKIKEEIVKEHSLTPEPLKIPTQKQPVKPLSQETKKPIQQTALSESPKKVQKPKTQKKHPFPQSIKSYLSAKDIEILSEISELKKEFTAKVRIDTLFGKQSYLLIAKEKKKITETDLTLALQKSQSERMPALLISPGQLNKKAQEYIKEYRNLIKFEKI